MINTTIKLKPLLISILIPLIIGGISGILTAGSSEIYSSLVLPPLSPPAIVFPIVWTIIYILMGIASYLIYNSKSPQKLTLYAAQLAVNFFWTIIFFDLGAYLAAFIWLIILWVMVVNMTIQFYKTNKLAGILLTPYVIWLTFAGYLNLAVYILNKS